STAVTAQNTPEHGQGPDGAERSSAASSRPVKSAAPLAEPKPKSSIVSPAKPNKDTRTSTDGSNGADRAQPPKRDWVVPFPKLDRTKSSTDSGARH
ncbi:MAG TPA: hypothetical protein VKP30_31045, partial [Polyangiaceae bacterium]|nr:hypothetical protein [Polyangiaceae bacterium]